MISRICIPFIVVPMAQLLIRYRDGAHSRSFTLLLFFYIIPLSFYFGLVIRYYFRMLKGDPKVTGMNDPPF